MDISEQVTILFEYGMKVNSFLISSGKQGMSIPIGGFLLKRKKLIIGQVMVCGCHLV